MTFEFGVVHLLAGRGAVWLVVLGVDLRGGSRLLGLTYLLLFGLGSVGGMILMSALIGLPFALTAARFRRIDTPARVLAGFASVAFGLYYAWRTAGGL